MRTRICDECKANPARFALRIGEEISYLCEPSFKEVLLGLVTSNDTVIFAEVGDMKARSLVSNAILWKHLGPQRANPPGHGPLALSAGASRSNPFSPARSYIKPPPRRKLKPR